jgi:ADP-ribose pyrophosphatase YjhB (NUDIX family)
MIRCKFENNNEAELRHVTFVGIILHEKRILLSKRGTFNGKPLTEFGKWALPGGYLDPNETLVQGLKRELMEECGCEIDDVKLLRIIDKPIRPNENKQNITFVFTANLVSQKEVTNEEVSEQNWLMLDQLPPKEQIAFEHAENIQMYMDIVNGNPNASYPARLPADLFHS